jgi:hypothetical protein
LVEDEYEDEEIVPQSEPDDEDWYDSLKPFEARLEDRLDARMNGGYAVSRAPFRTAVENGRSGARSKNSWSQPEQSREPRASRQPGLKKLTTRQVEQDLPPTPRGCEWRRSDDGLNLWRCWTEWDADKTQRIKKSRYAGTLSHDAWQIMKEYDHEAFISTVGERLRRHGGRQSVRSV